MRLLEKEKEEVKRREEENQRLVSQPPRVSELEVLREELERQKHDAQRLQVFFF